MARAVIFRVGMLVRDFVVICCLDVLVSHKFFVRKFRAVKCRG